MMLQEPRGRRNGGHAGKDPAEAERRSLPSGAEPARTRTAQVHSGMACAMLCSGNGCRAGRGAVASYHYTALLRRQDLQQPHDGDVVHRKSESKRKAEHPKPPVRRRKRRRCCSGRRQQAEEQDHRPAPKAVRSRAPDRLPGTLALKHIGNTCISKTGQGRGTHAEGSQQGSLGFILSASPETPQCTVPPPPPELCASSIAYQAL